MNKVFIVVKKVAYEGEYVQRVFAKYDDAVKYADQLLAEVDTGYDDDYIDSDVYEREVY
jgi:hypothetical protein